MGRLENLVLLAKSAAYHKSLVGSDLTLTIDGSREAFLAIDELSLLRRPLIENIFTLYACGIHDYKKEVLDPRQVLSMIKTNDECRYDRSVKRLNGMASGKFCCIAPADKMDLLQALCGKIESISSNFTTASSAEEELRKKLLAMGVNRDRIEMMSDKSLVTYLIANEMQFLLAIIHPFWERNGRTSEEAMHLVCATNGVSRLVFWDDVRKRHNEITEERMDLINKLAISLLPEIAKRMGIEVMDCNMTSVHDIYKLWYQQKGLTKVYLLFDYLQKRTPAKYIQTRTACLGNAQLIRSYHLALRSVVEDRISLINHEDLTKLMEDKINQQLLAHHLTRGKEVNMSQFNKY